MMPDRLSYIVSLIIGKFEKRSRSLPAPLLLKGENGVGKSWILSELSEKVFDISNKISVVPIVVKYHLTAKNIVNDLQAQIEKEEKKLSFINEIEGNSKKTLKFLLIWDGIDKLYNFNGDGPSKSPKRAFGAGSPKFQKIQYASELRSFLIENTNRVTIVGTCTYTDFMNDENLPFFNFFNLIDIKSLSHDESMLYLTNKIGCNEKAKKLLDIVSNIDTYSGIDICDGKISYLNIFAGSILEAVKSSSKELKELIKYFYALFFSKLNPFVEIEIENLSESEKIILTEILELPKNFYMKDVNDQGLNKSIVMKNLVTKEIITETGRGKNRVFSLKSEALKKWIKYHKDPDTTVHGL